MYQSISHSYFLCVSGAAEGDLPGVGQPGGAAALQHFLPGHPADHLHPAGPHPAHRLCLLAQPGRPAQQGPGQVRLSPPSLVSRILNDNAMIMCHVLAKSYRGLLSGLIGDCRGQFPEHRLNLVLAKKTLSIEIPH